MSKLERSVREALREFDACMEALVGCTDHSCMIRRHTPNRGGMGTNGGCKCGHDKHVASRYMAATTRLIKDIEAALDA